MGKKDNFFSSPRGQAVIELAIFGAILIFLIASIVQQGMSAAFTQNDTLQATRQALLKSYKTARGTSRLPPDKLNKQFYKSGSRNTASFLFLEDRLSAGVTRYGVADRQPIISQSSGTLSNKLFWVSDWDDLQHDLPLFDLKVNGQSFMLKAGAQAVYRVRYTVASGKISVERIVDSQWEIWFRQLAHLFKNADDTLKPDAAKQRKEVEEKLRFLLCSQSAIGTVRNLPGDVNPSVGLSGLPTTPRMERDATSTGLNDYVMFTVMVANDPKYDPSVVTAPHFDLERNGDNSAAADAGNFVWKWNWKLASDVMKEVDWETPNFPSYDVDGDLKEETVYHITKYVHSTKYVSPGPADPGDPGGDPLTSQPSGMTDWDVCNGDKIYDVAVMDNTIGETNSAGTETDSDDVPGLKPNTHVYTIAQNGTAMEIREGQSFVGSQELVTSFSTKKQFDVISREYQLNKNMLCDDTLCDLSYFGFSEDADVVHDTVRCPTSDPLPSGPPPSGTCCDNANFVYNTCFDRITKRLYIRSRIQDTRGRLWVTKTD
jgi:hypothetical protein